MLTQCFRVILRERPDVIISAGAAMGCAICIIGKLFGSEVVWVDSIACSKKLSLSGTIVRPFADLFLVQWPELADEKKKIYYMGSIL